MDRQDEDAIPPEPVAVVTDEGAAQSRARVANDSTPDAVELRGAQEAPASNEPEVPESAARARVAVPDEPSPVVHPDEPHPVVAPKPLPADPTEMPTEDSSMIRLQMLQAAPKTPPLLASDALMEDLAPLEPSRDVARSWCTAVGLGFVGLGALPLLGLRSGGVLAAGLSFFLGVVTIIAGLTRVSYRLRATAMLVIGLLVVFVGLGGTGPAAFISYDAPVLGFARAFAATALPGALLFRARYRAYLGARLILGGAFVLALPYVALLSWRLAVHEADLSTAGAIVALVVTLVGLVGFMGKETTGAGTYVGLSVLLGLGTELFLADASHHGVLSAWQTILTTALGSVAFIAATGLSALGLFQLLASRLSRDARQIDLHAATPEPSRPHAKKSEWTT